MVDGILGKKLGMTQIFTESGVRIPVTVIEAGPCTVVQKKLAETDGYTAVQLGFGAQKAQRVNKPLTGHFAKAGQGVFKFLREVGGDVVAHEVGSQIKCDEVFSPGDIVDVVGTSKGKGFQGVMKRWNFSGGRSSHGSKFHRSGGAIGCSASPAKVFKGKKMAGQMGNEQVTVQNLEIVGVRADQNIVLVKGAIPGPKNGLVAIRKAVKA
ncbi:MAG: 50S ribosomal protein L3 [Desulfuromonadaceae bacterium]|nr:50S ribosomal protein L3 [Desulfuromonadaceae bacterium]